MGGDTAKDRLLRAPPKAEQHGILARILFTTVQRLTRTVLPHIEGGGFPRRCARKERVEADQRKFHDLSIPDKVPGIISFVSKR